MSSAAPSRSLDGVMTGIRQLRRTRPIETETIAGLRGLAQAQPGDRAAVDLATYRGLIAPWTAWSHLEQRGRNWAKVLTPLVLETPP